MAPKDNDPKDESVPEQQMIRMASDAQVAKLREVMSRIDTISRLDKDALGNVTDVLQSAKSDGGCGIGCW